MYVKSLLELLISELWFQSYCQKHSLTSKKEKNGSGSEDEECKRKKRKDMTSEEKNQARAAK